MREVGSFSGIGRNPRLSAVLALAAVAGAACASPSPPDAERLHREAIVVDTHSDTTPRFEDPSWSFGERHSSSDGDMDLPRIREGGLDVQFWSIYMGRQEGDGRAVREALERIDAVYEMARRYPADVVVAGSVAEIRRGVADGKLVSMMGLEGGHIIEDNLAVLRSFYRLGVRYMTLTHSFHTGWADSSGTRSSTEPLHRGLTAFGEEVVREMNRIGMMVDVSHVSDATFADALRVSQAPVIASHSSVRAVADHRRNLDDDMLRTLAAQGGVVMINFYPAYIDEEADRATRTYFAEHGKALVAIRERHEGDPAARRDAVAAYYAAHPVPQTSLDVLLDHFDHAIAVAGPGHVGLGADWDGVPSMPVGMEEISDLPRLTEGLLARGHSAETVRGVLGENLLRAMEEAERVAARLQAAGAPVRTSHGSSRRTRAAAR